MPRISFSGDNVAVETDGKESILQASLRAGIAHTHVCGGKARCTTCRVMVIDGDADALSPPRDNETWLARKYGFAGNIRLACQVSASSDVTLRRLVIDEEDVVITQLCHKDEKFSATGMEKDLVILFADIRNFTRFSESQLPYDIIHMLNRYFYIMRRIIEAHRGQIYNYMGDGLLALFGVEEEGEEEGQGVARQAVAAGLAMLEAMDGMQAYLESTYGQGLDIGVGIHRGEVVIGSIDDARSDKKMVIGDAVNFASRIEAHNKEIGTRLLVSAPIYDELQSSLSAGKVCSVNIKGKSGEYRVIEILAMAGTADNQASSVVEGA